MTISVINSVSNVFIIDAGTAEKAVKEVIGTLRDDLHKEALSTLTEVRSNVFTYSGGNKSYADYFYKAYVEAFFGEFRVTVIFLADYK